jgi:hypothetical protein
MVRHVLENSFLATVTTSDNLIRESVGVKLEDMACPWEDIASLGGGEPPSWQIAD